MALRATWKGFVKISELSFPVALYAGASQSERVSFHIINRKTGHRVQRQYIDEETEKPVEREQQVKGYETGDDEYLILDPEEIAQAVPQSDKAIRIQAFIACSDVDTVYLDRPYFLAPSGSVATEPFAVMQQGMRRKKVAAVARAVLFRRVRTVLLRADGPGLVANTLNFDYQVRPAAEVFDDLPDIKIEAEMLKLAKHIIETKSGTFDPAEFDDRYDEALGELVKAKLEGREIKVPSKRPKGAELHLLDALRKSAQAGGKRQARKRKKAEPAQRRKAG